MMYIGLSKFGWRNTLKASVGLIFLYFAAMLFLDLAIVALKSTGLATRFILDRNGKLLVSQIPRINTVVMLVFLIAFPAVATLLCKMLLIDLAKLKMSITASFSLIDTASIPKQLEDLVGYNLEQLIEKF